MNFHIASYIDLECFIVFNLLVLMLFISFVAQTITKYVGCLFAWYFEAKAKFLADVSRSDAAESGFTH
jgi:hypothetical protein